MNILRAHPKQAMVDLYLISETFQARIFPKSQEYFTQDSLVRMKNFLKKVKSFLVVQDSKVDCPINSRSVHKFH